MSTSQGEFSSDQVTLLRDIAQNGESERNPYGYGDGSNDQSNGLPNSLQGVDDHAALLKGLANFNHPPTANANSTNETSSSCANDHFASLLEAAATAGEVVAQTHPNNSISGPPSDFGFIRTAKRKRTEPRDEQQFGFILPSTKGKRRRLNEDEDDQLAREREIWGSDNDDNDDGPKVDYQQISIPTADARAVGVHSAVALFRRPSVASKKYTRPPMSKLFTSLELHPEEFIHLQAAAKSYMLDERHPERANCIGNKAKGDADMTKLKLFAVVKAFLDDEGWGERCFGESSPGADMRRIKWPQMKNKLIALVTPLMRRMVTNEKQRHYASQARRDKHAKSGKSKSPEKESNDQQSLVRPSEDPVIEENLNQYHYNVETPFRSETPEAIAKIVTGSPAKSDARILYHVNIFQGGRRVKPRITLMTLSCPGFASLLQHIHNIIGDEGQRPSSIKILGVNGLVAVDSEDGWKAAIVEVEENEWMDGEVRVIVEMEQ
ncbi:hypothetical protein B7494_g7533 [Chlorociboria aeruginascens]|nr:hypothetical protein B7494_g7533 [Chlorociboria aeruginascens]